MQPGQMRTRVTIIKPKQTTNAYGEEKTDGYDEFATVWAAVEPPPGRELLIASQIKSSPNYRVTMRYLANVSPTMQITYKEQGITKTLDIVSVVNKLMAFQELEIMAVSN